MRIPIRKENYRGKGGEGACKEVLSRGRKAESRLSVKKTDTKPLGKNMLASLFRKNEPLRELAL